MDDLDIIAKYCRKEIATMTDFLLAGSAQSYEDYRTVCGKISTHTHVLGEIAKIQKKGLEE